MLMLQNHVIIVLLSHAFMQMCCCTNEVFTQCYIFWIRLWSIKIQRLFADHLSCTQGLFRVISKEFLRVFVIEGVGINY